MREKLRKYNCEVAADIAVMNEEKDGEWINRDELAEWLRIIKTDNTNDKDRCDYYFLKQRCVGKIELCDLLLKALEPEESNS